VAVVSDPQTRWARGKSWVASVSAPDEVGARHVVSGSDQRPRQVERRAGAAEKWSEKEVHHHPSHPTGL
jgi:hypothetical protein